MNDNKFRQEYWERNIEKYSGFYDKQSEENINGNKLITFLYKKFIFPIEKYYTRKRYDFVKSYILKHVTSDSCVADVGCGSGIFTGIIATKAAKVYALDFAQSALDLTSAGLPKNKTNVQLLKYDVNTDRLPAVDICIAIGLLPYVENVQTFFDNILPNTKNLLISFLDQDNLLNKLRRKIPFLNVRNCFCQNKAIILKALEDHKFKITQLEPLASGYMLAAEREHVI